MHVNSSLRNVRVNWSFLRVIFGYAVAISCFFYLGYRGRTLPATERIGDIILFPLTGSFWGLFILLPGNFTLRFIASKLFPKKFNAPDTGKKDVFLILLGAVKKGTSYFGVFGTIAYSILLFSNLDVSEMVKKNMDNIVGTILVGAFVLTFIKIVEVTSQEFDEEKDLSKKGSLDADFLWYFINQASLFTCVIVAIMSVIDYSK